MHALHLFLQLALCAGISAIPGVRILEYLHGRGEALDRTWPQPVSAVYINGRWQAAGTAADAVKDAADQGYNVILVSFVLLSGPDGFGDAWSRLPSATQASAVAYAHAKGAVVMLSVGGEFENPYGSSAAIYGQTMATWALANGLDGVDFDLENLAPGFTYGSLPASSVVAWLVAASIAARSVLGAGVCGGMITHAPQAPYFGPVSASSSAWAGPTGGYTAVFLALAAASPPAIDWLHMQYYNQGTVCYSSFRGTFQVAASGGCWAPGTAVAEIVAEGVPAPQIIVGKPLLVSDAGTGWVSAATLGDWVAQAASAAPLNWTGGVMTWQYDKSAGAAWLTAVLPAHGTAAGAVGPEVVVGQAAGCSAWATPSVSPSGRPTPSQTLTETRTQSRSSSASSTLSQTGSQAAATPSQTATPSQAAPPTGSSSRSSTQALSRTTTQTGSAEVASLIPSPTQMQAGTSTPLSLSPSPSPGPASCFDGLLDSSESDADCGGPFSGCARCVPGRSCRASSDCDLTLGSSPVGALLPGAPGVVCNGASARCADVRASPDAWSAAAPQPPVVSLRVRIAGIAIAAFTAPVFRALQRGVASALAQGPSALIIPSSSVLVASIAASDAEAEGASASLDVSLLLLLPSGAPSASIVSALSSNTIKITSAPVLNSTVLSVSAVGTLPAFPLFVEVSDSIGSRGDGAGTTEKGRFTPAAAGTIAAVVILTALLVALAVRRKLQARRRDGATAAAIQVPAMLEPSAPFSPDRTSQYFVNPIGAAATPRPSPVSPVPSQQQSMRFVKTDAPEGVGMPSPSLPGGSPPKPGSLSSPGPSSARLVAVTSFRRTSSAAIIAGSPRRSEGEGVALMRGAHSAELAAHDLGSMATTNG